MENEKHKEAVQNIHVVSVFKESDLTAVAVILLLLYAHSHIPHILFCSMYSFFLKRVTILINDLLD